MNNTMIASRIASVLNDRLINYAPIVSSNTVVHFEHSNRIIAHITDEGKIIRLYTTIEINEIINDLETF